MDLPMAQIPNFQLPGPNVPYQGNLGTGLAAGLQQGIQNSMQMQQLQLMKQKQLQEQKQEEFTRNLGKFGKLTELYKNTDKHLRPRLWADIANQANSLLGTQLDPSVMPESGDAAINAAHQEIQNLISGKQSFGDTMKKLGMLTIDLNNETRAAIEASKGFLQMTPEFNKMKEGNNGSFAFAGYDPITKQPVFSYSKAPILVGTNGQQVTSPIQSKADMDKVTEETRKITDAENSVSQLETLLSGGLSGAKGASKSAVSSMPGGNLIFKDAAQYNDQLPVIAVQFYRLATGDQRLSDDDARKRALPFLPRLGDKPEVQQAKIAMARNMLAKRKENLNNGIMETPLGGSSGQNLSGDAQKLISKWEGK